MAQHAVAYSCLSRQGIQQLDTHILTRLRRSVICDGDPRLSRTPGCLVEKAWGLNIGRSPSSCVYLAYCQRFCLVGKSVLPSNLSFDAPGVNLAHKMSPLSCANQRGASRLIRGTVLISGHAVADAAAASQGRARRRRDQS
jgi:hypothetical protein